MFAKFYHSVKALAFPALCSFVAVALSSCATDYVPETTEGMFEDPNTKRLKQQEKMSKITRELSIF